MPACAVTVLAASGRRNVRGIATITSGPSELRRFATEIGARYMGRDHAEEFGQRNAVPGEVLVRVTPERGYRGDRHSRLTGRDQGSPTASLIGQEADPGVA